MWSAAVVWKPLLVYWYPIVTVAAFFSSFVNRVAKKNQHDDGAQVKVYDSCEFPMELNMRPYTKEGLLERKQQQQQQERQQQGKAPADDNSTNSSSRSSNCYQKGEGEVEGSPGEDKAYPDAYYEYKLAGVLVHMGTADSGHYYSYIKRRDTQV